MNLSTNMLAASSLVVTLLFNAAWQVPLCYAVAALAARLVRTRPAVWTHRIWVAALLLEVLLPLICVLPWSAQTFRWAFGPRIAEKTKTAVTITMGPLAAASALHLPATLMFLLTAMYSACVLLFGLRMGWGLLRLGVLRRGLHTATLDASKTALWDSLCKHFGIGHATLCVSRRVHSPQTLGVLRPLVLLPSTMLQRISVRDLRVVLAHECAHVKRRDFALNLIYETLGVLIAWHPCFWFTRSGLQESREWVCDELAAQVCGTPQRYARSLLSLATLLAESPSAVLPHAIGMLFADAHAFERRLMRLSSRTMIFASLTRRAAQLTLCILLGTATCTSAWAWRSRPVLPMLRGGYASEPQAPSIPGGVMAGNVVSRVNPVYPPDAKTARIQGSVVLQATIGEDGRISSLEVVSGPPELRDASLKAVHQWTYKPYLLDGKPVAVQTTITVNYNLNP